jgi:uncharacterized protein (TIGR02246 family)
VAPKPGARTVLAAAAVVCALLLAGCETAGVDAAALAADLAAIEALNQRILRGLNEGDAELLNSTIADDHIMMIPNRAELTGRDALESANRNLVESWNNIEIWTPAETVVFGDYAYQRGAYDITLTPKREGVAPIRSVGKYIHIYRRQPDGEWLITRDIFNSNAPE